ncbi:MAG TPA: hypothetical protein VFC44_24195, partial [Candidatus Saccharimonadales bacterium]|nr:hypothetical protein [Candidatus Saccharimonadales bacterium]
MNKTGEETIASHGAERPRTAHRTTFPAEDLAELLARLQKRNLELEARNLEMAEEKLPASATASQFQQLLDS